MLMGLLQLGALWGRTFLNPVLFLTHYNWECGLRALFFLLVFWGRFRLFQSYRNPVVLTAGFGGGLLLQWIILLIRVRSIEDWFLFGLTLIDCTVLSVFAGIVIEFTGVILREIIRAEAPFGYLLSTLPQRFRVGEEVLLIQEKLLAFYTCLLTLGLYALNLNYVFNWFYYTRTLAVALTLLFLLPLGIFNHRLKNVVSPLLHDLEERMERQFSAIKDGGTYYQHEDFGVYFSFRQMVLASIRTHWSWESVMIFLACLLFLLSQPYLVKLFFMN